MKTLRELLTKRCEEDGFNTDDESLEECLRESGDVIWEGEYSEQRWRTTYTVVSKLDGRLFRFSSFIARTEGDDAESCGYAFEGIDNVVEVVPYEKVTIAYKALEDEGPGLVVNGGIVIKNDLECDDKLKLLSGLQQLHRAAHDLQEGGPQTLLFLREQMSELQDQLLDYAADTLRKGR